MADPDSDLSPQAQRADPPPPPPVRSLQPLSQADLVGTASTRKAKAEYDLYEQQRLAEQQTGHAVIFEKGLGWGFWTYNPKRQTSSDDEWDITGTEQADTGSPPMQKDWTALPPSAFPDLYTARSNADIAGLNLAPAGAGVQSYLQSEGLKQDEITRQAKDYIARSTAYENLLSSELAANMAADDQNIANQKAAQQGLGSRTYYATRMGAGPADALGQSIPDNVAPDYRLNQAVGLPGDEGWSVPGYADGTVLKKNEIPPGVALLVGVPANWVHLPPRSPSARPLPDPWPWGVK